MHRQNWTRSSELSRISSQVAGREGEGTLIAASTRTGVNTAATHMAGVGTAMHIPRTAREAHTRTQARHLVVGEIAHRLDMGTKEAAVRAEERP